MPEAAWGAYSAPIEKILIDPNDEQRLLACGGSRRRWGAGEGSTWAVWESRDGGQRWRRLSEIGGEQGMNIVAAGFGGLDSSVVYAAVDGAGVWRSDDGGLTWSRCPNLPHQWARNLRTHPADAQVAWAAMGKDGVFATADGGKTWTVGAGLSGEGTYDGLAVCAGQPEHLLATDMGFMGGTVYGSSDGGRTWSRRLNHARFDRAYAAGCQMHTLAIDPRQPRTAFAANTETVMRTRDGGTTWIDVTSRPVAGDGRWRGTGFSGLCSQNFRFNPANPRQCALLAMDHGNCWISDDDCASWSWAGRDHAGFPTWGGSGDIAFGGADGSVRYLTIRTALSRMSTSVDAGATWRPLGEEGMTPGDATAVHCLPDHPECVWAVAGGRLCRSIDGGDRWREILHGDGDVREIVPRPDSTRTFFITDARGVHRTDDGENFVAVAGDCPAGLQSLCVSLDPLGHEHLVGVTIENDRGTLHAWSDGAWRTLGQRDLMRWVARDPHAPERLVVTTSDNPYHDVSRATGVWITSDGGATWSQQNAGLAMTRLGVIRFDPRNGERLVCGSNGRGYWTATWPRPAGHGIDLAPGAGPAPTP